MKIIGGFLVGLICGIALIFAFQQCDGKAHAESKDTPVVAATASAGATQTQPGKLCLKNGVCIKDDFSDGAHTTQYLQEKCRKFTSGGDKDAEAGACFNFLQGVKWGLNIDTFVRLKEQKPLGTFCFHGSGEFLPYDDGLPFYFLKYLQEHPEMHKKNVSYVLYKMYEDNGQRCDDQETQKTGETQK